MVAVLGAYAWHKQRTQDAAERLRAAAPMSAPRVVESLSAPVQLERDEHQAFQCDGRKRCSQMSSCDEARFFVRNCPNVEMDGDGDGKPCEDWCGH